MSPVEVFVNAWFERDYGKGNYRIHKITQSDNGEKITVLASVIDPNVHVFMSVGRAEAKDGA
jgi:hypothetical protein